jgi:hypothetical protein
MTQPQQDVQQDQAAPSRKTPMQRFTDLCVRYV